MKLFKNYGLALAALASSLLRAGEIIFVQGGYGPTPYEVSRIPRGNKMRFKSSRYRGPEHGAGFARRIALKRKFVIKGCRP